MLGLIKSLFNHKCYFCKGKDGYFAKYEIKGKSENVCYKCVGYAERRAFRKVN